MTARALSSRELVVLSFPGADRSIRMEDFEKGQAVSRRHCNRRIGEFLKELDLAEGRSTGVPKILRAMPENGSPAPVFESDEDRTWFLVRLPVHERVRPEPTEQDTPQDTEHETEQVTAHETGHETGQVTGQVEQLVESQGQGLPRMNTAPIVSKVWSFCTTLRDDLDNLPEPDDLAEEIIENLEAGLNSFRESAFRFTAVRPLMGHRLLRARDRLSGPPPRLLTNCTH